MFPFTDASFDGRSGAGLGSVVVNTEGKVIAWFSLMVGMDELGIFLEPGRQTIIGELETLVVSMSLLLWGSELQSTQLMIYIDNEGSKYALIKGYSVSLAMTAICALASTCLDEKCILPWFSRVPSPSNLADYPSRGWKPLLRSEMEVAKAEVQATLENSMRFVGEISSPQ